MAVGEEGFDETITKEERRMRRDGRHSIQYDSPIIYHSKKRTNPGAPVWRHWGVYHFRVGLGGPPPRASVQALRCGQPESTGRRGLVPPSRPRRPLLRRGPRSFLSDPDPGGFGSRLNSR